MPSALLTTKLYMPPVRRDAVTRPRLLNCLNKGLERKLTLVSAPAGSGKTTLLSEWIRHDSIRAVWLSLDDNDNDAARFLTYMIAALQMLEPDIGKTVLTALQLPNLPPLDTILTPVINEIAALDDQIVLVLDDYHLIDTQTVHDALIFLLTHLPSRMHLVIATRADPPLPLGRLRTRALVTEIRANDLRFTQEETREFLNEMEGFSLSAEEVAALETRTEGWIAGLQLAALSMQGRDDIRSFIEAFAGTHRYILDYLTEEVLSRQLEYIQDFLLQTSILDRLTGSLCDAVTGQNNGQSTLERLEQVNLFIVPLDDGRNSYRYHHLFGDMLRRHLKKIWPDQIPELHRRASAWYEQNDLRPAAIAHSLEAADFEQAADLVERTFNEVLSQGEYYSAILSWMELLPQNVVDARPRVGILHAWMLALTGQIDAVEPRVQAVERAADGQLTDAMLFEIAALRAYQARQMGQIDQAIELSLQAAETYKRDHSSGSIQAYTGIVFNLSIAYQAKGNMPGAHRWFSEAVRVAEQINSITFLLAALSGLARVEMVQGHLFEAQEICQQALQQAAEVAHQTGKEVPAICYIQVGLAEILREWGRLDEAVAYLNRGIELGRQVQIGITVSRALSTLALVKLAQGDMTAALEAICQAEDHSKQYAEESPYDISPSAARIRLLLAEMARTDGDIEHEFLPEILNWAEDRGFAIDAPIDSFTGEAEYLIWVRLLIALNDSDEALRLLTRMLPAAEAGERVARVIEILILQALAYRTRGDTKLALCALENALGLAEPQEYVRMFLDEGKPMVNLLHQAGAQGIRTGYVSQLLSAATAVAEAFEADTSPLVDPLSERELEILRLIALGCSNPEIADELVLAIGTVKSHTGNIYSKLEVRNRTEAVVRARELNLL